MAENLHYKELLQLLNVDMERRIDGITGKGSRSRIVRISERWLQKSSQHLRRSIFYIRRGCGPGAMRATEESSAHLYAVADDSAFAMLTNRRDGLNGTLKAFERVAGAGRY